MGKVSHKIDLAVWLISRGVHTDNVESSLVVARFCCDLIHLYSGHARAVLSPHVIL